jgi:hypothetical protein
MPLEDNLKETSIEFQLCKLDLLSRNNSISITYISPFIFSLIKYYSIISDFEVFSSVWDHFELINTIFINISFKEEGGHILVAQK